MKVEEIFRGFVNCRRKVTLDITKEQSEELMQALKVLEKYKKQAISALEYDIEDSDWHMLEYTVKSDCVIVDIQDGACG